MQVRGQRRIAGHSDVKDPQREVLVLIDGIDEKRILRASIDEAVDAPIKREERLEPVALGKGIEFPNKLGRLPAVSVRCALGREARFPGLEMYTDLVDRGEVGDMDLGHECAAARDDSNEAISGQPLHGLTDGCPADAELYHQFLLSQEGSGRKLRCDDLLTKADVGSLCERWRRVVSDIRSECAAGRCHQHSPSGVGLLAPRTHVIRAKAEGMSPPSACFDHCRTGSGGSWPLSLSVRGAVLPDASTRTGSTPRSMLDRSSVQAKRACRVGEVAITRASSM